MSKLAKILVTVGALFVYLLFFAMLVGVREASGHTTPGFMGIILLVALIGAIRAIWKSGKKNGDNNNDNDTSILQK